ncbi:toxin Fic [Actinomycetota bacterium]|nr:toxin Fic [Actinomycetota bacterium]
MHEVKEATLSSKIEGTNTGFDEALQEVENIQPEKRDDWHEIQNYVAATRFAIKQLDEMPLMVRLLKNTHALLLKGVRGEHKTPGEFRRSQNWIGGASISDARFIPPAVEHVDELMSDLEKYWHLNAINTPKLIKAALSHYQFETIHPFLDGNGRLGRLIIVLYLVDNQMISKPILYLSDYFNQHKNDYYEALDSVRNNNDIEHWIKFFLVAVSETAKKSCETLEKIIVLKSSDMQRIAAMGKRSRSAADLLNYLYGQPIVTSKSIANELNITHPTANSLLKSFVDAGILNEITGYSRNRQFAYTKYLGLFAEAQNG